MEILDSALQESAAAQVVRCLVKQANAIPRMQQLEVLPVDERNPELFKLCDDLNLFSYALGLAMVLCQRCQLTGISSQDKQVLVSAMAQLSVSLHTLAISGAGLTKAKVQLAPDEAPPSNSSLQPEVFEWLLTEPVRDWIRSKTSTSQRLELNAMRKNMGLPSF